MKRRMTAQSSSLACATTSTSGLSELRTGAYPLIRPYIASPPTTSTKTTPKHSEPAGHHSRIVRVKCASHCRTYHTARLALPRGLEGQCCRGMWVCKLTWRHSRWPSRARGLICLAHRDLIAGQLSPSGLANRYGAIPFAFPAAVELVPCPMLWLL